MYVQGTYRNLKSTVRAPVQATEPMLRTWRGQFAVHVHCVCAVCAGAVNVCVHSVRAHSVNAGGRCDALHLVIDIRVDRHA